MTADSHRLRRTRAAVIVGGVLATALIATVALHTFGWVGRNFPGFFVISNRVVPSIALPDWPDEPSRFFQAQVIAVDSRPVTAAAQVYQRARDAALGTPIEYEFRRPDGETFSAVVATRRFSLSNYAVLFGAYLLTGVVFLATGVAVYLMKRTPASAGLLASTAVTGVFITTAADLYGPWWFVRLHVLAECLLTPSYVHLALVFPSECLPRIRRHVLTALYAGFGLFALWYEVVLGSAPAYTSAHLIASASHGAGALTLIGVVTYDLLRSPSALVRRRVAVVAIGTLSAFLVPGILMAASAIEGGRVALNAGVLTACLFPLSLGYAIVKRDLFELDVFVRRAVTYSIVIAVLAAFYLGALSAAGSLIATRPELAQSPAWLAVLNLVLVLLSLPIRARVQRVVDRLFFRSPYDAERALSDLGRALVAAKTIDEVIARTRAVLDATVCPTSLRLLEWRPGDVLHPAGRGEEGVAPIVLPRGVARRLADGETLLRVEWDEGPDRSLPEIWRATGAEILLPVGSGATPSAVLALGRKASGRAYDVNDARFLWTAADQVALAIASATVFARLAELNATLEGQVRERTASIERVNTDLAASLGELRAAYAQLERNQASLVRAERLATLGRLAAGIAHEVNTPLGAAMNSLRLIGDLGREYEESIGDPAVTPQDHREIARDLRAASDAAMLFTRKAATFVNKVRVHGRDSRGRDETAFSIAKLLAESSALVAHRLRISECTLAVAVDEGLVVRGSAGLLSQVLINLINNAIDAYEDGGMTGGAIEVHGERCGASVSIEVRDRAGGIPPDVLPHIFEELFTTKDPGRGTGLGLWIARNVIEQSFGGTLTVAVDPGVGTCFTVTLPYGDTRPASPVGSVAAVRFEGLRESGA